jgi:hypothetical protein
MLKACAKPTTCEDALVSCKENNDDDPNAWCKICDGDFCNKEEL